MFAFVVALGALIAFTPPTFAQNDQNESQYTVWSSVILTRTGERTPEVLGTMPTQLTARGANQAFAAGKFFRDRYIMSVQDPGTYLNQSEGKGAIGAPLHNLAQNVYDPMQLFAITLDQQWNLATAQAFLQGLYPPFATGPSSILADGNNTLVVAPLNGSQYPQIHSTGGEDYNFIYLAGNLDCPSFVSAAVAYTETPEFSATQETFNGIYDVIGSAAFQGILDSKFWNYRNAYAIYDYLRYQVAYNATISENITRVVDVDSDVRYLDILRWLADENQYAQLGNTSAVNVVTGQAGFPNIQGSISTIAGNTLAARILDGLQDSINNAKQGAYKLNLLFADYHPFMSFFALMGLPEFNEHFYGTPNFAASMVFELYSYVNTSLSDVEFPHPDDLWVRFWFRNGTDDSEKFTSYSLFGRGPSQDEMTWNDFRSSMSNILMASVGDWCTLCNANKPLFCTAYIEDEANSAFRDWLNNGGLNSGGSGLNPAVSGVIGAIVALVVAGIIFALFMLIGGVRLHRNKRDRKGDLGGFKGGQKMRSDEDLTIPKGGAVVGASVERSPMSPPGGHERVGSWELKNAEAGRNLGVPSMNDVTRPSMEEHRRSPDPFSDVYTVKPVQPSERV